MPSLFKHLSQIQTRADYDKLLRKALTPDDSVEGVGPAEEFHYLEEFPFDKKPGPLVLVGDVSKSLLGELKKLGSGYARGTCKSAPNKRVLVDIETGKVKPKLINVALKTSGLKLQAVVNGEEPEPDPELQDGPTTTSVSPPDPQQPQVVAQSPTPPPKPNPSPEQLLWMDKVKVLRPAFDKALLQARTQDPKWAEDLDSNFAQMMQEARGGNFKPALESLKRLAVIIRSREAARAEVLHQTRMEDSEMAPDLQQHAQSLQEQESIQPGTLQQMEQYARAQGLGYTSDGVGVYTEAITPDEWRTGITDPLRVLASLMQGQALQAATHRELVEAVAALKPLTMRASQLAEEEADQPALSTAALNLRMAYADIDDKVVNLKRDPGARRFEPDNIFVTLNDVELRIRAVLTQKAIQLRQQVRSEQNRSPEQQRSSKQFEQVYSEQAQAFVRGSRFLQRQLTNAESELDLAEKVLKLKQQQNERVTEKDKDLRGEAELVQALQGAKDEVMRIKVQLNRQEALQKTGRDPGSDEEDLSTVDVEALSQFAETWNRGATALRSRIDERQWPQAKRAIGELHSALFEPWMNEAELPKWVDEVKHVLEAVNYQLELADSASQTSPALAIQAVKKFAQASAEYQKLYFK